ncbi:MAG: FtsX-like permease family protein [Candidatus Thalassarchaeum sp.]|nr:FtsX-like permease family protein [Candidatus Thalassarchaeum sp.]
MNPLLDLLDAVFRVRRRSRLLFGSGNRGQRNLESREPAKKLPLRTRLLSLPDNLMMAGKGAWRGRERVLAVFAGVFMASLVITTVLAYAVGLSGAFLQYSLQESVFDAKVDFADDPGPDSEGRTNDSVLWESLCDDFVSMDEFIDCGIVYGRQGIRVSGFFDDGFITPQPLNVVSVGGTTGDWANVSWDYSEALEWGPPINGERPIRFYGDGIWDGEFGERHSVVGDSSRLIYGSWPPSAAEAAAKGAVVLPSMIASEAGVSVNDTISSLTFTYVTDYLSGYANVAQGFDNCTGTEKYGPSEGSPIRYCVVNMTVEGPMTVVAVYQEEAPTNPTLLFHPVMVSASVLSDEQKTILMDNDHGYLGLAVDRNELPTSSTSAATGWLDNLKDGVESGNYTSPNHLGAYVLVEYNDMISGTITFLNIFLGIIQVFDYILMIPIVVLSFSVLIYGLVLSLEQRKREVSIHRVIGGTKGNLSGMIMLEISVISFFAWLVGYLLALAGVPVILAAVGFMSFKRNVFDVTPTLSLWSTFAVILVTVGLALLFGRSRTNEFLSIEIDEGVRRVSEKRKPRYWLHTIVFLIGLLSYVESWIQGRGGVGGIGSGGLVGNFILNALLLLFGPFFLWIGGALVLGRIGAAGPRIMTLLFSWSPAVSDIRRGLKGSGSSESVNRLAVIMLLTLSIVTLAAVQGFTGTEVDERTTSAQNGADIQVQFASPVTEQQAREEVMQAIQRAGDSDITGISQATSVADIFTGPKGKSTLIRTWVLFDDHEQSLIWDTQAVPGDDIAATASGWKAGGFTAGSEARSIDPISEMDTGDSLKIAYTEYGFGGFDSEFNPIVTTTVTESTVSYMGRHQWVPGLSASEAEQAIVIGESTYRELVGNATADSFSSARWFFELCDQSDDDCADALRLVSAEIANGNGITAVSDWPSVHSENERNGGLIFGTPGLLSLQFVVASLASVASAFVFLSLVLTQRKKELAILQAIGASPNQVIRLVLFEIMAILLVSMGLGVVLGLAIAESFNGFFGIFGFIFQLFLGQSAPIDRDLVWPWLELALVNASVLVAVVVALLYTTRRALQADLAVVLKGE